MAYTKIYSDQTVRNEIAVKQIFYQILKMMVGSLVTWASVTLPVIYDECYKQWKMSRSFSQILVSQGPFYESTLVYIKASGDM